MMTTVLEQVIVDAAFTSWTSETDQTVEGSLDHLYICHSSTSGDDSCDLRWVEEGAQGKVAT